MGQKIHPGGLRVGIIHEWKSAWFSERDFGAYLAEDIRIREHILGKLSHAADHDRHLHGTSRHRDREVRQRGRRAAP